MELGGGSFPGPKVLAPSVIWTHRGDSIFFLNGPGYRIDTYAGGSVVASIRRSVDPIEVTPQMAVRGAEFGPGSLRHLHAALRAEGGGYRDRRRIRGASLARAGDGRNSRRPTVGESQYGRNDVPLRRHLRPLGRIHRLVRGARGSSRVHLRLDLRRSSVGGNRRDDRVALPPARCGFRSGADDRERCGRERTGLAYRLPSEGGVGIRRARRHDDNPLLGGRARCRHGDL